MGLTGPVRSGKTLLLYDVQRSLEMGRHGFPQWRDIKIDTGRDYRSRVRKFHGEVPGATVATIDIEFDLIFRPAPDSLEPQAVSVHVRDAPGKAAFPGDDAPAEELAKHREGLDEWFAKATGIILVISVLGAGTYRGFGELVEKVEEFFQKAGKPQFERLQRIVVAISMFDLLMLRFGPRAFDVASDPEAVLRILHAHVRPAREVVKDFRPFGRQGANVELRFLATSSFGFHPGFGCPNVEVEGSLLDPAAARYPDPLKPEQLRYPYMTADPFVFASLGIDGPFLFTRDEMIEGTRRNGRG